MYYYGPKYCSSCPLFDYGATDTAEGVHLCPYHVVNYGLTKDGQHLELTDCDKLPLCPVQRALQRGITTKGALMQLARRIYMHKHHRKVNTMLIQYNKLQWGSGVNFPTVTLQQAQALHVVKYNAAICSVCKHGDNGQSNCIHPVAVDYSADNGVTWASDTLNSHCDTRDLQGLPFCPCYNHLTK